MRVVLAFAALWLAGGRAFAAPAIDAEITPRTIGVGEQAVYTVVIDGAAGGELTAPRFGDLVVSGPSTSSQSVFMFQNGQQTIRASRIYSWTVQAPREGKFTIGPATFRHTGDTYLSDGVELEVTGQGQPQVRRQPRRQNPWGAVFPDEPSDQDDPLGMFGGLDRWGRRGETDVFLRAVVDKRDVYLGEQATLSLYLYSQAEVAGVSTISFPKLDGFWAEDVESPTQLVPEEKVVKGVAYRAYLLRRRALFALRSGELTVDPVEATVNLGLPIFRGANAETVKRKSAALTVNVKPLPAEGQPPDFDPAHVGRFTLESRLTPAAVALGQPAQLRLRLEGVGNIKGLRVPKPALPPGLKTYDPTVTDKVSGGTRYGGTKTLEYVVIAERTGMFELPPIELTYFDPAQGTYEVARTSPQRLAVTAGEQQVQARRTPGERQDVSNVLSNGVRPIRLSADLSMRRRPALWERDWFWPTAVGPIVLWGLVAGAFAFAGMLRRRDPGQLKVKRAKGVAGKRLKRARELLDAGDSGAFLAEIIRAMQQFVTDKTGVGAQGLTREELGRELVARGYRAEEIGSLVKILERCETARFSSGQVSSEALKKVLEDCHGLVTAIDSAKPGRRS